MFQTAARVRVVTLFRLLAAGLGLLAIGAMVWAVEGAGGVRADEVRSAFGRLPLAFEPVDGNAFLARGPGYLVRISSVESAFLLRRGGSVPAGSRRERLSGGGGRIQDGSTEVKIRCRLEGADVDARLEGRGELRTRINHLIGGDPAGWRIGVPVFGRVWATGVYPGIDLVYYGNQNQLEYDFVVGPGADPGRIRMVYEGVTRAVVDGEGDLVLETAAGWLRKLRPIVYQEEAGVRRPVRGAYRLHFGAAGGAVKVGFELGDYDTGRALVIDPVFYYSTYLGGLGEDRAWDVAVASDGLAVIVGETASRDFPVDGVLGTNYSGGAHDVFVAKLGAEGTNLVFSTYLGGSADEGPYGLAIGPGGDIYITGATASTNFPVTPDAVSSSIHGIGTLGSYEYDAFVTRLNSTGTNVEYSTYLGGSLDDNGLAIAVDDQGAAYVAGFTQSPDFLEQASGGPIQGLYDAFVLKMSTTTNRLESGFLLGGALDDRAQGIAVGTDRRVVVVGYTGSTNFPVTGLTNPPVVGAWQPVFGGGLDDAWVAGLDATGGLAYCSYLGGSGVDEALRVALDGAGRPVVVGLTGSTNFPVVNSLTSTNAGGIDWFITRLDSGGAGPFFSTYVGGVASDEAWGVAVGVDGSIHVSGNTVSTNFPVVKSLPRIYTASPDAVLLKLTPAGDAVEYATTVGGVNGEQGYAVAVDTDGHAYLAGSTTSLDFPVFPTTNVVGPFFSGVTDAFVARVAPEDALLSVSQPLAGQVRLAWSKDLPGFRLYSAPAVPTYTNWTEVLEPVEVVGGEKRVNLTNLSGGAFFQLRR